MCCGGQVYRVGRDKDPPHSSSVDSSSHSSMAKKQHATNEVRLKIQVMEDDLDLIHAFSASTNNNSVAVGAATYGTGLIRFERIEASLNLATELYEGVAIFTIKMDGFAGDGKDFAVLLKHLGLN